MKMLRGSAPKLPSLHLAKVQALVFRLPIVVRVDVVISGVA